jgi:Fe-S-cluster-containing dehydrogenase component
MKRRQFLKFVGALGATAVAGPERAEPSAIELDDSYGVLSDLSLCDGCRTCELACAETNDLPEPEDDETLDEIIRPTSETQWSVVNCHETSVGDVYVKKQCMHCNTPACSSACLTKALFKTEEGPVIWREDKCMGCRFCMVSCPFDVPKFEYDSANPRIQKCRMCWERQAEGEIPACVEECPSDAMVFGKRSELLEIARERIHQNPGEYVSHIYGEHEAGGTGWLYISPVPFEELGFRTDLGETAYPEYSRPFLTSVPVVLIMWPAFLLALRQATKPADDEMLEPDQTQRTEV